MFVLKKSYYEKKYLKKYKKKKFSSLEKLENELFKESIKLKSTQSSSLTISGIALFISLLALYNDNMYNMIPGDILTTPIRFGSNGEIATSLNFPVIMNFFCAMIAIYFIYCFISVTLFRSEAKSHSKIELKIECINKVMNSIKEEQMEDNNISCDHGSKCFDYFNEKKGIVEDLESLKAASSREEKQIQTETTLNTKSNSPYTYFEYLEKEKFDSETELVRLKNEITKLNQFDSNVLSVLTLVICIFTLVGALVANNIIVVFWIFWGVNLLIAIGGMIGEKTGIFDQRFGVKNHEATLQNIKDQRKMDLKIEIINSLLSKESGNENIFRNLSASSAVKMRNYKCKGNEFFEYTIEPKFKDEK